MKDGGYPQKGTAVSFFRRHIYYTMNTSPFSPGDKVVGYCRYSEGDEQGQRNTSTDEKREALSLFIPEITVYVKSRRELLVSVAHGIPGFLSVAEKTTKNDVRPWNYEVYTCNLITDIVIIHRSKSQRILPR